MLKNLLVLFICLLSASCSSLVFWGEGEDAPDSECPNVEILRSESYLSQTDHYKNKFKIEIYGYEGYCWFDPKTKQAKAYITPLIKLTRLDDSTDEGYVMFDWYYRTSEGPTAYLGYKTIPENTVVPPNTRIHKIKGKSVNIRVPSVEDGKFKINLGLRRTTQEDIYNSVTFDLN